MKETAALILAAGKGTRMKSRLPKVLHRVGGLPMAEQVLHAVQKAGTSRQIMVIGFGSEAVQEYFGSRVEFVLQEEQLGTGHAVMQAAPLLETMEGTVVITCGDTPLVTAETFREMMAFHEQQQAAATILTAVMDDPTGYGRIIRNEAGHVVKIVEQKDGAPDELAVQEINTGIYCFDIQKLLGALKQIGNDNAQGEYYLTDAIGILVHAGDAVAAFVTKDSEQTLGVNSRVQLAEAERILRARIAKHWMEEGVTIIAPMNTYIGTEVVIGKDTILYPGTILEGATVIGEGCEVGPYTRLTNVTMGNDTHIHMCYAHDCEIKNEAELGPFAHFRPDTVIGDRVKVGNFVEVKNSVVGAGTKFPHLSYIGDSDVGDGVNMGCGTITVNYDGKKKHRTVICDHAFVGCNSNLVAPVTIEPYAYVAAGTTVTKDVPENALAVGRAKQKNIEDWVKEDTYKK